ncbi:GlcG/HbpS family heme-binding protein [Pedobacter flavus]|uniref:Heme-binding protein n=1 Tax=Pedobacter flavus TaxID=3113906 RepID=A0ABU7H2A8_9SPHI|nr:heme-binding protein [Pedobacter sp. VNH31]MEE1885447.1 heme-binding protein [Pedobacter sp. VNH31]
MKYILNLFFLIGVVFSTYGQVNYSINTMQTGIHTSNSNLVQTNQLTLIASHKHSELSRNKAYELGKKVSIAVLDAGGQVLLISKGDHVGIHNTEAASRKAYTAVSTKTEILILARNARSNPDTQNLANLPELLLLGIGVPIYHNGKVIGAIGIAGGGSPENDDLIGKAARILDADIIAK